MNQGKQCLLIGNTRWHWALKEASHWKFVHTAPDPKNLLHSHLPLSAWAAVGHIPSEVLLSPANQITIKDVPLIDLPPWLGIDRALGAWSAFSKAKAKGMTPTGLLVADAGTVLSITRISANGEFQGGQLVGGFQLQLNAMAKGTKALTDPGTLLQLPERFPFKTWDAMQRGSLQALLGTLIQAQKDTQMPIWLCGGDAPLLLDGLKEQNLKVIHHPNLVLEGMVNLLNKINQGQDL